MDVTAQLLRECPFFASFSQEELTVILNRMEKLELSEDDSLFEQNDPGDALYILIRGKLIVTTVHKNIEKTIGYVKSGEVVGELSIFSNEPRSASVKAFYPSIVMRLKQDDFHDICRKNPEIL